MTTIIATALLTVFVLNILLAPFMLDKNKQKQGWIILIFITLLSMGLYLWRGAPDIASKPALFETQGENFERRQDVKKELSLMQDLATHPQSIEIMLKLGAIRLKNGRLEEAISILTIASDKTKNDKAPHDKTALHEKISLKLGAAHYAAALFSLLLENDKIRAKEHFDKALSIAPASALYRERLLKDSKSFEEEGKEKEKEKEKEKGKN